MEISGDMGPMAINYQKMVEMMLQNKDEDGDGALSIDEISIPKEAFAKIDTDQDGLADVDELKAFFPKAHLDRNATEFIAQNDANGDGTLSIDELTMPQELFSRMDTNADGQLDKKELENFKQQQSEEGEKTGGKSGKGKGDDETTESVVEIDTDGDGIADTEEVTTLNAKGEVQSVVTRDIGGQSAF